MQMNDEIKITGKKFGTK